MSKLCEECGLPLLLCEQAAFLRMRDKALREGNLDEANEYLKMADEAYDMFLKESGIEHDTCIGGYIMGGNR